MKICKVYERLKGFAEKLGDEDFTVSLAICEGSCYISVSCHSSRKYEFDHGGLQRTAKIDEVDLEHDINDILDNLVNKYKECLVPRKKSETLEDAIKRAKKVSSSSSR